MVNNKMTFSEKERNYVIERFDDSLQKMFNHYKRNYDSKNFINSENDFVLLAHYFFVNYARRKLPRILSSTVSEFESSKKSSGIKKVDLGVIEWKNKWWPIIAAEFKYFPGGGKDLSNLHNTCKNDFGKLKEEKSLKNYFIVIHNPNNPEQKNSREPVKKEQIKELKEKLKNKKYRNLYLFYMTPTYYIGPERISSK